MNFGQFRTIFKNYLLRIKQPNPKKNGFIIYYLYYYY